MKSTKFIIFGTVISLVTLLLSCSNRQEIPAELLRPVRYQEVVNLSGARTRTLSGIAQSGVESKLSFRVGGTINFINVKIGEHIAKNSLIASLDDSDYELQYEQSHATEQLAKSQRDLAKSNYKRIEALYENGNVSVSEYEQAKTAYESAKAEVKAIDRQTDQLKKKIEYTKLYAPIDGIVANLYVERNENVQAGQVIVDFYSGKDPEVIIGMPETFISRVSVGEKVSVEFPSIPEKQYEGTISEVSFVAGQQSSTYPVTIKLKDDVNKIRPGMTANVTFSFLSDAKEKVILVPSVAVGEEQKGTYVYVVRALDGDTALVSQRYIDIGTMVDDNFEVLKGLEDGELVVTAGISKLSEGMKVKLLK